MLLIVNCAISEIVKYWLKDKYRLEILTNNVWLSLLFYPLSSRQHSNVSSCFPQHKKNSFESSICLYSHLATVAILYCYAKKIVQACCLVWIPLKSHSLLFQSTCHMRECALCILPFVYSHLSHLTWSLRILQCLNLEVWLTLRICLHVLRRAWTKPYTLHCGDIILPFKKGPQQYHLEENCFLYSSVHIIAKKE
jgi:hypothetical protein